MNSDVQYICFFLLNFTILSFFIYKRNYFKSVNMM